MGIKLGVIAREQSDRGNLLRQGERWERRPTVTRGELTKRATNGRPYEPYRKHSVDQNFQRTPGDGCPYDQIARKILSQQRIADTAAPVGENRTGIIYNVYYRAWFT